MKYPKRLSFLNGFLNVVMVIMIILFIGLSISYIITIDKNMNDIISLIVVVLLFSGYFVIVMYLKGIIGSIRQRDPFNLNNISYFKNIGYIILAIGIVEAVINYPKQSYGLEIMATSYGSIKPIFFLYLVLSILSFILSDVFRMAMEIKDENDLTV